MVLATIPQSYSQIDEHLSKTLAIQKEIDQSHYTTALKLIVRYRAKARHYTVVTESARNFYETLDEYENQIYERLFMHMMLARMHAHYTEANRMLHDLRALPREYLRARMREAIPEWERLISEKQTSENYFLPLVSEIRMLVEQKEYDAAKSKLQILLMNCPANLRFHLDHLMTTIDNGIMNQRLLLAAENAASQSSILVFSSDENLTPGFLITHVMPYIHALEEVQHVIDEIHGRSPSEVTIKALTQNSPITVALDGAKDVVGLLREIIVPWRRKHAKAMAMLEEKDKIQQLRTNEFARKVRNQKEWEELERQKLENQKLRQQLDCERMEFLMRHFERISPSLSEADRIAYQKRLVSSMEKLLSRDVDVM